MQKTKYLNGIYEVSDFARCISNRKFLGVYVLVSLYQILYEYLSQLAFMFVLRQLQIFFKQDPSMVPSDRSQNGAPHSSSIASHLGSNIRTNGGFDPMVVLSLDLFFSIDFAYSIVLLFDACVYLFFYFFFLFVVFWTIILNIGRKKLIQTTYHLVVILD